MKINNLYEQQTNKIRSDGTALTNWRYQTCFKYICDTDGFCGVGVESEKTSIPSSAENPNESAWETLT